MKTCFHKILYIFIGILAVKFAEASTRNDQYARDLNFKQLRPELYDAPHTIAYVDNVYSDIASRDYKEKVIRHTSEEFVNKIDTMFRESHGRRLNDSSRPGHHRDHSALGIKTEVALALNNGINKPQHNYFYDFHCASVLYSAIAKYPKIYNDLCNMRPGDRKIETVPLNKALQYKGNKRLIECGTTASRRGASKRAAEVVFVIDKMENGKFHLQTAYPKPKNNNVNRIFHDPELGTAITNLFPENPKDEYLKNEISNQLNTQDPPDKSDQPSETAHAPA